MSLLLDHGHPEAQHYPVGMVFVEAEIVVERLNGMEATRAVLIQMAASSVMSRKGAAEFQKLIKRLTEV